MSDDLSNRGAQDRARININEQHEVNYWTKELDVSEEELKRLVAEYGPSADAVRQGASRVD